MLKGCEIYINGAPCPMCMSAIYWARIDPVYFGGQPGGHEQDRLRRRLPVRGFQALVGAAEEHCRGADFEREACLAAYRAWENKKDRHPY